MSVLGGVTKAGLTVNTLHLHTVTGPRYLADEHFARHGVCLWLRACGTKAVFFYRKDGRKTQRTFKVARVVRQPLGAR